MSANRNVARTIGHRVLTVVGAVVALGFAGCGSGGGRTVTVLRGKATSDDARTAIGFDGRRVAGPRLHDVDEDGPWVVAGASWFDGSSWHDQGTPACLERPQPQPIELGVVEAAPGHDAPGRGVVVWLKCLTRT